MQSMITILMVNDEYVTSLTKRLFYFTKKCLLKCLNCGGTSINYAESNSINVNPVAHHKLSQLVELSMLSYLTKLCNTCKINTRHEEITQLLNLPTILTLVINRFDYNTMGQKITTPIIMKTQLVLNSHQFKLLATIQHHGDSTMSGHWTSNVLYPDAVYCCNDNSIQKTVHREESDTVYVATYARCEIYP